MGDTRDRYAPVLIDIPGRVVHITAGDNYSIGSVYYGTFSLFITQDEGKMKLYGCGKLELLQLNSTRVKFLGDLPEALFKPPAPAVQTP